MDNNTNGFNFLTNHGLNLMAVFDCSTLPESIHTPMIEAGVPLTDYTHLVLLGHAGQLFWQALTDFGMETLETEHPVDYFSLTITQQFIEQFLADTDSLMLYPQQNYLIPLQRLGALANWHHPSPLGIGINAEHGLWWAYRATFLTTANLPLRTAPNNDSPCDHCSDKRCISACPAQGTNAVQRMDAVQEIDTLNLSACLNFRMQADSPCQDRCLSRLACPVRPEHRYTMAQIQYHYRHSLETIREFSLVSNYGK